MSYNKEIYMEHRPWGSFENLLDEEGYKVKRLIVKPHKRLSLQSHEKRSEHWVVVKGPATIWVDDRIEDVEYNDSRYIPAGSRHRLENKTDHEIIILEVQCGTYFGEDDIKRYEDDFNRN